MAKELTAHLAREALTASKFQPDVQDNQLNTSSISVGLDPFSGILARDSIPAGQKQEANDLSRSSSFN